jgi:hypothetical protein
MDKKLKAEEKRQKRLEPKKPQDETPIPAEDEASNESSPPDAV